jgi:hypothetical protein
VDTGAIVIDRGELDFSGFSGDIHLEGNRGFSLTATVSRIGGGARAVEACSMGLCRPDTVIPLFATWMDSDLRSCTVTLDGTTYTQVGGGTSSTYAGVQFWSAAATAPEDYQFAGVLAPPFTNRGSDEVTAVFKMSGFFGYPEGRLEFSGQGVVKLWLAEAPGLGWWKLERLLYRFKHRP